MFLKNFEELPKSMQNEDVKKYYDILEKKKVSMAFKRIFDIVMSLIILIILFPIMIILAICIKVDSKGPVFYRQERVTTNGKLFRIFKFRTMVQNADKIGNLVTVGEDKRITRVGKFIRKFRLDEFPQLLNIITGDMSFVGTRPEVKKYVDQYSDCMKATLLMPAGVTSIASIQFKDENEILNKHVQEAKEKVLVSATANSSNKGIQIDENEIIDEAYLNEILPEKMKYNLEYIENFSALNDLKICVNTVIGVLK